MHMGLLPNAVLHGGEVVSGLSSTRGAPDLRLGSAVSTAGSVRSSAGFTVWSPSPRDQMRGSHFPADWTQTRLRTDLLMMTLASNS